MAKVVLVGYGQMLYSLIEGIEAKKEHKILGVFRSDRLRYSGFSLFIKDLFNASQDYTIIKSKKLYDIKAKSVNDDEFLKEIEKLNPDLIIVGSWAQKFKKRILDKLPIVNFHPALLPKNRGANPYFWSIFLNQQLSGLTIHYMNEFFDRGDIILQEPITIGEEETGKSLKDKTTRVAKVLVGEFLDLFDKNQLQPIKQNEEFASYEPQITKDNVVIDLNQNKQEVSRHLRALYPWAVPYVKVGTRYIEIKSYEFIDLIDNRLKNYDLIENTKKYFILKGNDFLIRIYK